MKLGPRAGDERGDCASVARLCYLGMCKLPIVVSLCGVRRPRGERLTGAGSEAVFASVVLCGLALALDLATSITS